MGAAESASVPEITKDSKTVSDDFAALMNDNQFSDVSILTNGLEYRAHKAILAARSPVFAGMFKHEMRENLKSVIHLDIDDEILKETLRYIYTGSVENLRDLAPEMIKIADQYMLDGLKTICVDSLCQNVAVENAISTFELAEVLQIDILNERVKEFIRNNVKSVVETPAYNTLRLTGPDLLDKLYRDLAANFKIQ